MQRVVRVKKTDEVEDDDSDITEDEIQALSQGLHIIILITSVTSM